MNIKNATRTLIVHKTEKGKDNPPIIITTTTAGTNDGKTKKGNK